MQKLRDQMNATVSANLADLAGTMSAGDRMNWRMPSLALLKPAEWSSGRKTALLLLRGYLVISVLLLIVKAVQLG